MTNITELTNSELEEIYGGESAWYWLAYNVGRAWSTVSKTGGESISTSGAMN